MNLFDLAAKLTLDSKEFDSGIDQASQKIGGFGSTISSGLSTAAKAVGAGLIAATSAVTAFAKSSVQTGMTFDSSMSQVAATMGLTMDQMNEQVGTAQTAFGEFTGTLGEFAQYMGSNTAFSASQAADALNYMALAGYDAQTSMDMLPNVLNLAAAGGMELATASDMVTDASSALGLSLEETSELVDMMAMASSKSNTSVSQLGNAILTVGGTAKNLAGGTTELATALGILADNGVKGAEGGTALRNIILSLSAPTGKAAGAMDQLGVSAYDADGNLRPLNDIFGDLNGALSSLSQAEKTNFLNEIFNKVDLKSVNALMANTNDEFRNLFYLMDDYDRLEEVFGVSFDPLYTYGVSADNLADALSRVASQEEFAALMMDEYGVSADQSKFIWEQFSNVALESSNRFDELSGYIDDAAGSAQQMADTQLDNLSGDITLFQSALEGAQIAVAQGLTPTLREFVKFGSSGLSQLTQAFNEGGLSGAMDALGVVLSDAVNMIVGMLPQFLSAGASLLASLAQGIIQNLPAAVGAGMEVVTSLAHGISESIPSVVATAVDVIINIVDTLIDNVPLLLDAAIQIIIGLTEGIIENLPTLIERIPEIIERTTEALIEAVPMLLEAAIQIIVMLGTYIIQELPRLIAMIPKIITGIISKLVELAKELWTAAKELIHQLAEGLMKHQQELIQKQKEIIDRVKQAITDKVNDFLDAGRQLVQGIWNGISNAAQWLWDQIAGFASGIVSKFKSFLGIRSPSKVMRDQVGLMIGRGVGFGIMDAIPDVEKAVGAVNDAIMGTEFDVPAIGVSGVAVSGNAPSTSSLVGTRSSGGAQSGVYSPHITIEFTGDLAQLGRLLQPVISSEGVRIGGDLVTA